MLELAILGFLAEGEQHAYVLRGRLTALSGHVRPVSDGTLKPALRRLESRGLLHSREEESTRGPSRRVYGLSPAGLEELRRRLTEPDDLDLTDHNRFMVLLAFLHHVDDPQARRDVLERRLAFLEEPGKRFFLPEDARTPYRDGMTAIARGINRAEQAWLHQMLADA